MTFEDGTLGFSMANTVASFVIVSCTTKLPLMLARPIR